MKRPELNRRDFNRLTMAALGGMVAGTVAGCGGDDEEPAGGDPVTGGDPQTEADGHDVALLMEEPHVCRGLNTCKGKCVGEKNECAGQGTCATVSEHSCHETNECKGQGGCGEYPGQNSCKTKGECAVPLSDKAWATARPAFEEAMQAAGNDVGAAPAG